MIGLGILASHAGTTAQAVIDGCAGGAIDGTVRLVVSNNAAAGVLDRARLAGVPARHLGRDAHPDEDAYDEALAGTLAGHDVDLVVLAGWLRRIGPRVLDRYAGRIVNVHPALLPRHGGKGMYGPAVHRAVIEAGDTVTGATVHLVDAGYDTGAVLARREVAVAPGDDAAAVEAKVRAVERPLLVETLARIARGELLPAVGPSSRDYGAPSGG